MDNLDQIKKFKMLIESTLVESYEDRVNKVADAVVKGSNSNPVTPDAIKGMIGTYAREFNVPDYTVSQAASNAFVKDVLVQLKGKLNWKRKSSGPDPERLELLRNAIRMVTKSLENITDGIEPIDYILDRHRKYGFVDGGYSENITNNRDFHTWMNMAAKAIIDGNEYGTDAELAKYVAPAGMQAASNKGYYSDLVSTTTDAFIEDHPDLATSLGYRQ